MKKITLLSVLILGLNISFAQTPLPAGNYYVPNDPGNSSVFYTSLTDAFEAINFNGLAGDITLYINGDINQSANVGLINPSEYTITIRPDADVDRTITFSQTTDNAGPSGALCIGIKNSIAWADLAQAKNITIDGYAEGGSTRRLKIATSATQHGGNGPILIINDCSNIQIKNTIIYHEGASSGSSNYGVYLRCNTLYGTNKMPADILIENNHITAVRNSASQGVGTYANAAPGTAASGVVIKNNVINARTRGVFLNYVNGIDISGNEFHVVQTNASTLSSGIMGNAGLSGDIKINSNRFVELKTYNSTSGDYGMKGVIASGGGTWYVDNNFFSGIDKSYGSATSNNYCTLQAIRCGSTTYIRHNTFYMKSLTYKPVSNPVSPTSADPSYCAINIAAGTPEISNNIFISNETDVPNFFIRGTNGGVSDYNVFYFDIANTNAYINGAYRELGTYQEETLKDENSKFYNVEFADATAGNLSIAGASVQNINLKVPSLANVTTDIFGTVRNTSFTYAGAHESTLPFLTVEVEDVKMESIRIKQMYNGIEVELEEPSNIELYTINGTLIDKTRTDGVYSRELGKGMFIIRVNGQAQKFVR
ncbi:MAG: hypothetical protein VB046_07525 [Paludibacter sp.]|jgi:hypothetical protein|nr:hypothetical protein [Paludibacter sp.]